MITRRGIPTINTSNYMSHTPTTMTDYRSHVERMFDEGSSIVFTNKDRDHAAVLISTLFTKAKKEVVVLCRNLDGEFYKRACIEDAMQKAAARNVSIKIKVQEQPDSSDVVEKLQATKNVEISILDPKSDEASAPMNFIVMDGKAFRLERDRNTSSALACANDPDLSGSLMTFFNSLG